MFLIPGDIFRDAIAVGVQASSSISSVDAYESYGRAIALSTESQSTSLGKDVFVLWPGK
jgi:hypothetical protein